jgi:hypothetical protein
VLLAGGNGFVEVVIFLSSTVPVIGLIWFAWWFLRAGKRHDERERAACRRPTGLEAPAAEPPTPGTKTGRQRDHAT